MNDKIKEARELLEQAERCIRPPSSFAEKAHGFIIEALSLLKPPCERCAGLKVVCKDNIGLMFGGVAVACPICKGTGIQPDCSPSAGEFQQLQTELTETITKYGKEVEHNLRHQVTIIAKDKTITAQADQIKGLKSQEQPCSSTCYHHQTHPCEQCGRINGYLPSIWEVLKGE